MGVLFLPPFPLTLEKLPLTFKAPGKQVKPGDGWDAEKSQRGSQEFPSSSADCQHPLRGGNPYAQHRVSARSVESLASLIIFSAKEEQRGRAEFLAQYRDADHRGKEPGDPESGPTRPQFPANLLAREMTLPVCDLSKLRQLKKICK